MLINWNNWNKWIL